MRKQKQLSGFGLIEVLVGMALLLTLTVGVVGLTQMSVRASAASRWRLRVENLLKETMEEVMAVRASNFSSLSEGVYYPEMIEGKWSLVSGKKTEAGIERWVEISRVQRQISCGGERVCPIVASGGVVDPVTFKAKVKVSWEEQGELKEEELESLLSFWR